MIIRFTRRAGIYNAGEVAGFNRPHELKVARDYVQRGVAVEVERDKKGAWVPVAGPQSADLEQSSDLTTLSKDELVALAAEREVNVTRADGKGTPTKDDYIRALSAHDEGDEGEDEEDDAGDEGEDEEDDEGEQE